MREIKFRAWDKHINEMWNAEKLTLSIRNNRLEFISYKPDKHSEITTTGRFLDTDRFILMQYTGLKDKNGKEIYEGDIVKYNELDVEMDKMFDCPKFKSVWKTKKIVWKNGYYEPIIDVYKTIDFENIPFGLFEVIGDIYQNPELLEVNNE